MGELDRIFLRAHVDGKWGSYSLGELMRGGKGALIGKWFIERVLGAVGCKEGELLADEHILNMIKFLENNGIMIYRLKE